MDNPVKDMPIMLQQLMSTLMTKNQLVTWGIYEMNNGIVNLSIKFKHGGQTLSTQQYKRVSDKQSQRNTNRAKEYRAKQRDNHNIGCNTENVNLELSITRPRSQSVSQDSEDNGSIMRSEAKEYGLVQDIETASICSSESQTSQTKHRDIEVDISPISQPQMPATDTNILPGPIGITAKSSKQSGDKQIQSASGPQSVNISDPPQAPIVNAHVAIQQPVATHKDNQEAPKMPICYYTDTFPDRVHPNEGTKIGKCIQCHVNVCYLCRNHHSLNPIPIPNSLFDVCIYKFVD